MRPAATLALFAYNQEDYVRAAIEGAFAQDFGNLEIILSDDCSSDRTFAIMQEMAAAYAGPHRVIARQERLNAGPVQHLINVARAATGDLLVVNAGDDISYAERVTALYAAWKETGATALSSWHDEIDAHGKLLRKDVSFPPSKENQRIFRDHAAARRSRGVIASVPGFASAYARAFWADLPDPPRRLFIEDGIASSLIILRGQQVVRVERSLIAYRLLDSSLSIRNAGRTLDDIKSRERQIELLGRDTAGLIAYVTDQAERERLEIGPRTLRQLRFRKQYGELVSGFWSKGPIGRIVTLLSVRTREQAAYVFPRLLGWRSFVRVRALVERFRAEKPQNQ